MKKLMPTILASTVVILASCNSAERNTAVLTHWSFNPEMIFPADRSLTRPEDGVALTDGRLIVADQVDGLRLVRANGASRPFGELAGAGYLHSPPESEQLIEKIEARIREGTPWLDLMAPDLWEPGPGLITGMILSPDDGPVYLTGLGNTLIQLKR